MALSIGASNTIHTIIVLPKLIRKLIAQWLGIRWTISLINLTMRLPLATNILISKILNQAKYLQFPPFKQTQVPRFQLEDQQDQEEWQIVLTLSTTWSTKEVSNRLHLDLPLEASPKTETSRSTKSSSSYHLSNLWYRPKCSSSSNNSNSLREIRYWTYRRQRVSTLNPNHSSKRQL